MMLKPKGPITKAKKSATVQYLMATEYYIGADGKPSSPSVWNGKLAERLGIAGQPVKARALENVFEGFSPDGREALTKNAGKDSRKNLAYDCPLVVPKSVSIIYAHSTPEVREKIVEALHRSNGAAIEYLESRIQVRTGKGGEHKGPCHGLSVASTLHVENRAGEPHMHIHNPIAAMAATVDAEGRPCIASIDAIELHAHVYAAGAIADCVMARELSALGIVVEEGAKHGYRVAAVPSEIEKSLSKRGDEITDEAAKKGRTDKKGRDFAQSDTKGQKKHLTTDEMDAIWEDKAKATGWGRAEAAAVLGQAVRSEADVIDTLRSQSDEILDALARKTGKFTRDEALMNIALRAAALGGASASEVGKVSDEILAQAAVVSLGREAGRQTGNGKSFGTGEREIFTTVRAMRTDVEIRREFMRASKDDRHIIPAKKIPEAIAKFEAMKSRERGTTVRMADEQRAMVEHIAKSGRQALVIGDPGTGKTFSVEALKELLMSCGYDNFEGAATASAAASGLKVDAKLDQSSSIAGLLLRMERGEARDDTKTAVIIDEAAMADPYSVLALQKYYQNAKLVFVGDPKQLSNIEGGGWMRGLTEEFGAARLENITRQKNEWHIDAIKDIGRGRADLALQALEARKIEALGDLPCMNYHADSEASTAACVDAYLRDPSSVKDKIMIAATNAETRALNELAHDRLVAAGKITGEQTVFVRSPKNPEDPLERKIGIGEKIVITKNAKLLGIENSDVATVESIKAAPGGGHRIGIRLDKNGETVTLDTNHFPFFDQAAARTNYKVQGKTLEQHAYVHLSGTEQNREFWYVALSRSKQETAVFAGGEGDAFRKQLAASAVKSAAKGWTFDHLSPEDAERALKFYEASTGKVAEALPARIGERDYEPPSVVAKAVSKVESWAEQVWQSALAPKPEKAVVAEAAPVVPAEVPVKVETPKVEAIAQPERKIEAEAKPAQAVAAEAVPAVPAMTVATPAPAPTWKMRIKGDEANFTSSDGQTKSLPMAAAGAMFDMTPHEMKSARGTLGRMTYKIDFSRSEPALISGRNLAGKTMDAAGVKKQALALAQ